MKLPGFLVAVALSGLWLWGCGNLGDPVVEAPAQAPRIAYDSSMSFFAGSLDARSVQSTGGPVTGYAVSPALPQGLSLDAVTGEVAGAAATVSPSTRYTVTATGPGGTGSAAFELRVHEIVWDSVSAKPRIAYATPVFDTLGKAASHSAISTGGPVTAYTIHPALSAGFTLNASTGRISGTPTAARAQTEYRVVASGPGGRDTTLVRITVATAYAPPRIEYSAVVYDTVGIAAHHVPTSTGGPVTSYAILGLDVPPNTLPDMRDLAPGLRLDSVTGVISGTPAATVLYKSALTIPNYEISERTHLIVASGPGGKDTASIRIVIRYPFIWEPIPPYTGTEIRLTLNVAPWTTPFTRMIVTLQSNAVADPVVYDTIAAGTQGFSANASGPQSVSKAYAVKPLRHWTLTARAYDGGELPIQAGAVTTSNVLLGETRAVDMTLSNKVLIVGPGPVEPLPKR